MKKISWVFSLLVTTLMTIEVSLATDRVGNFALLDHQGNYHQLRKYGDSKALVIISTAASCIENIEKLPKYRLLRTTWERQGISFLAINSYKFNNHKEMYFWMLIGSLSFILALYLLGVL